MANSGLPTHHRLQDVLIEIDDKPFPEASNLTDRSLKEINSLRTDLGKWMSKFFEQTTKNHELKRELESLKRKQNAEIEEACKQARREHQAEIDTLKHQARASDILSRWLLQTSVDEKAEKIEVQKQLLEEREKYGTYVVEYGLVLGTRKNENTALKKENEDLREQLELLRLDKIRLATDLQDSQDELEDERQRHDRTWESLQAAEVEAAYLKDVIRDLDEDWVDTKEQVEDEKEETELEEQEQECGPGLECDPEWIENWDRKQAAWLEQAAHDSEGW